MLHVKSILVSTRRMSNRLTFFVFLVVLIVLFCGFDSGFLEILIPYRYCSVTSILQGECQFIND